MSAPVILYMFLNAFAPVVVSDSFITTLVFDEAITSPHTGASAAEIYLKLGPNKKMLFIKSKGRKLETNLNVPTKSGKLYSFLIKKGENPHSIIKVKDGKKDELFKSIKYVEGIEILESSQVAKIENLSNKPVQINSILVNPKERYELPKGAPIFLNGKRVHR